MLLKQLTVKQSLNKAYRLIKPERADIEKFKASFKTLLGHINPQESEENMKGHVMDFLKTTWYSPIYHIATKGRTDFVIHTGKEATLPAGVLFETKKPSNPEMVTLTDLNRKAMHEIILYYLQERIEHKNDDINYLVITSIYDWFVFDAQVFEKLFFKNTKLVKDYKSWRDGQKVSSNNDHFYNSIAKPILAEIADEIEFTYFNIKEYEKPLTDEDKNNDNKLIPLFKILSPTHLLKLPFANDSNTLDKSFYNELLYIIGLEEVKDGGKKIIRRRQEGMRLDGSLLENTIVQLETENCLYKVANRQSYGATEDEQLFSLALELCITWINRVLFLKLLEAQLLKYHKGNKNYRFLNYKTIPQFDELYKLFFQVLAVKQGKRIERVKAKYRHIPYLNSSLFEKTALEDETTIRINMLDDDVEMPLLSSTILKEGKKPIAPKLNTLQYLFDFLNAYDFASEGSEEIQEERKTLINASVLGLIFEKINGYKDGSIYTPGFITMYMCRQSIRQSVIDKFKEKYKWQAENFEDLHNYVTDNRSATTILEYNALINSLTICDPAVGSGHFLVSALNELIAIKSELGILADRKGKRLTDHIATVENDELLVTDKERNFFTYWVNDTNEKITIPNTEVQRVQETLFHEKQSLIENSLFGVDINPKSVQICRLRLWIELLKNAYYIADGSTSTGELQTLPNIDINIKTGNSLISRFALDEDLKPVLAKSKFKIQDYKTAVKTYREATSKDQKREMENLISVIKNDFTANLTFRHKSAKDYVFQKAKVVKLSSEINRMEQWQEVVPKKLRDDLNVAIKKQENIEKVIKDLQNNTIYRNSFEWRFEFPEVLDNSGGFAGFDIVIGNPPYLTGATFKEFQSYFQEKFLTAEYQLDLYTFFIELSYFISNKKGSVSLITPNSWMKNLMMTKTRNFMLHHYRLVSINPNISKVFEEAQVDTSILFASKELKEENDVSIWSYDANKNYQLRNKIPQTRFSNNQGLVLDVEVDDGIKFILSKIRTQSEQLETVLDITRGVNPYDKYQGQSSEVIQSKAYHSNSKKDETFVPELRGKHVANFAYKWDGKHFISYGKWLAAPRDPKYFIGSRILFREILGERFVCTRIDEDFVIDRSLYIARPVDETINVSVILGILSSKLLIWLFKYEQNEFDSLFPKIRLAEFKRLPIPKNLNYSLEIGDISNEIIALKRSKDNIDVKHLENKIDQLVYQLYNLTPEEIAIVEQSTKKEATV